MACAPPTATQIRHSDYTLDELIKKTQLVRRAPTYRTPLATILPLLQNARHWLALLHLLTCTHHTRHPCCYFRSAWQKYIFLKHQDSSLVITYCDFFQNNITLEVFNSQDLYITLWHFLIEVMFQRRQFKLYLQQ